MRRSRRFSWLSRVDRGDPTALYEQVAAEIRRHQSVFDEMAGALVV